MNFLEPFETSADGEVEKNADLALYLLNSLDQNRESRQHIWLGDRQIVTLQYTAHVVEALYNLNIQGITTGEPVDRAADWLQELPLAHNLSYEENEALRIYPTRLKTLALLNRFDHPQLVVDFAELSRLIDERTGWIHNAPTDLSPTLVTMIWIDTLLYLWTRGVDDPWLRSRGDKAIAAVKAAFEEWLSRSLAATRRSETISNDPGPSRTGEIINTGDASYALHLLIRAGCLPLDSPLAEDARQVFNSFLGHWRFADMRRYNFLYCGIHLRNHFRQDAEVSRTLQAFVDGLRERYQSNECQREPIPFHALALRLLVAHEGDGLRQVITHKLWQQTREQVNARRHFEQQQLRDEFIQVAQRSIRIDLSQLQRFTGTRARGEIYRLQFGLVTEATDERGLPYHVSTGALRLVVKKGPREALVRAVERYRELPEPLQALFAQHTSFQDHGQVASYLVMQDLADMQPLSELVADIDRLPRHERQATAAEAATAVARALHRLHGHNPAQKLAGHLNLAYIGPMMDSLNRLCQPGAFPELKRWFEGPLMVNGRIYRRFDWYLSRIAHQERRLRPVFSGYAHDDCHSRNIMLNRSATQAAFVDIDTLTNTADYIVDYGLLLEDLAVYQSLPYGEEAGRVRWEDIQVHRPQSSSDEAFESRITYPAFPCSSEAVVYFQRKLVEHLTRFAESHKDPNWKQRLWLATARGLLLLASRQVSSRTLHPHRRSSGATLLNDLRLVQVAYAEALRLMHELSEHLGSKEGLPLPELPFPGQHQPLWIRTHDVGDF